MTSDRKIWEKTTGRMLVLLAEGETTRGGVRALADAGLNLATASDFSGPVPAEAWTTSDGVVFDELGVALIGSPAERGPSVRAAIASMPNVIVSEPERYKYVIGPLDPENLEYLRGYRDGVNQLVDNLLTGAKVSERRVAASREALTWGLVATRAGASQLTGKGVKVAILDTGLDLAHPDFQGRHIVSQSFVPGETVQDGHGHGTHTAGTACGSTNPSRLPRYGVAPGADLYIGKVLGDDGGGEDGWIINGINWALRNGCRVISMSLGVAGAPPSQVYENIGRRALGKNAIIIAAAGNESNRAAGVIAPVGSPANCQSILAVAAVDQNMQVADFSCQGQIDVSGPGVGILSSYRVPPSYRRLDGTSMATPHVSGIAALVIQANPGATGGQVWAALTGHAKPLSLPAIDVGSGLVQAP